MADSPIHLLLNDIRIKYSGKKCSLIDIRNIENQYNICSILNTRNDGIACLRITCFGLKQVMFEDICLDSTSLPNNKKDSHNYIFNLNKALYEVAYGIDLDDSSAPLIDDYQQPSIDFYTMEEEIKALKEKCDSLEKQLEKINNDETGQISLF